MGLAKSHDEARNSRGRRPTATASFGSSRRESHDASAFYERFVTPELSSETSVVRSQTVDVIYPTDARAMTAVESNSVALVVTSPPYFAGKEYEESLGENGVPATYFEYLALLRDVFAECQRVLEPGGRIAVNVANLGRRPYRSLAGDVATILQDLGMLLRGEVVWWKGRAAGGSCAWGTFQRPNNPVLRDVTERVVIASKGRFDRAVTPKQRAARGLPSIATISRDEFLEATTDLWEIPPESATRVGHPAPFPVELPRRLIDLYTYEDDVVLDPFMGSGTTAVAAVRTRRRYIGFETDAAYVDQARGRVAEESARASGIAAAVAPTVRLAPSPGAAADEPAGPVGRAIADGLLAKEFAAVLLADCGFRDIRADVKLSGAGVELGYVAADKSGREWGFDVSGAFTSSPAGLRRADTLWKALGRAAVIHAVRPELRLVLLTTDPPVRASAGAAALRALTGPEGAIFGVIELLAPGDHDRLRDYAQGAGGR